MKTSCLLPSLVAFLALSAAPFAPAQPPPAPAKPATLLDPPDPGKGEAEFPDPKPDHDLRFISAVRPVIRYHGMEITLPGEGVPRPMFSRRGWRGEVVFSVHRSSDGTSCDLGELIVRDGKLVHEPRIHAGGGRGMRFALLIHKDEQASIQKIGFAFGTGDLTVPRDREWGIHLYQEDVRITGGDIGAIPPVQISPDWLAFNVLGQPMDFMGKPAHVIWLTRAPRSGRLHFVR